MTKILRLIFFGAVVVGLANLHHTDVAPTPEQQKKDDELALAIHACIWAQDAERARQKAPSSAEFSESVTDTRVHSNDAKTALSVVGSVDAINSLARSCTIDIWCCYKRTRPAITGL